MLAAFTPPYIHLHPSPPRQLYTLYTSSSPVSRASFRLRASSDYDREEVRWLREEQRWLREESRWLREEKRWISEREELLNEISELKGRIEAKEITRSSSSEVVVETVANLASVLQGLKKEGGYVGRIAEIGDGPSPIVLEEVEKEKEEVFVKEIRVLDSGIEKKKKVQRKVLKNGAEGEEVKALQVFSHIFRTFVNYLLLNFRSLHHFKF